MRSIRSIVRGAGLCGLLASIAWAPEVHALSIPCTEAAIHARIAALNAACTGDKTITFDCPAGTVIPIAGNIGDRSKDEDCDDPGSNWSLGVVGCSSCPPVSAPGAKNPCTIPSYTFIGQRTITCDGVTIDGQNKVTFDLKPGCNDRRPDDCSEVESGDFLFRADAANVTFKNFTYRYFWEGLQAWFDSSSLTMDNVVGIRGCDDVFSSVDVTGGHHVIKNSKFKDGCDKCVQVKGREVSSTTYPDYDISFLNNIFENCQTPLGFSEGRHLVVGNQFVDTGTSFQCHGPYLGHYTHPNQDPVVYFGDNTVFNCKQGMRIDGSSKLVSLGGNEFKNNGSRAVAVVDNARALFQNDVFMNNGGVATGWGFLGGIVVGATAQVDLGGGSITIDGRLQSSAGGNVFDSNRSPDDSTLDVNNETTAQTTIKAEGNLWGDANPADQVKGAVDFTPIGTGEPPGNDPLPPPDDLWRTDSTDSIND